MSDSPHPLSEFRDWAASGLAGAADAARPFLAQIGRSLALLAWRVWITVGPLVLNASRSIAGVVQRAEEAAVPALIAAARSVHRTVQRAEDVIVPALIGLARAVASSLERAEGRLVPALAGAGRGTAGAVVRGQETVSSALASSGRGLVEGLQRVEAFTVPVLSPRVTLRPPPEDSEQRDPEEAGMALLEMEVEGEYVPAARHLEVRPVEPPQEVWRRRARSAGTSLAGMLVTTTVVVLAVVITARETVGTAIAEGSDAVGVEFRLPEEVGLKQLTERSYIYASDGQTLQVLDREENRRIVDLAEVPLLVQQAVITAEDQRFYSHEGYDPEGIGRAVFANLEAGDISQGGSTITQQLARSAPGVGTQREGVEGFMRKFREIAYAIALEEKFAKDELLGQYLNQVYLGENAYGIAAAAEEYFGITDVRQLQIEHGALLAAIIRQPNNANPRSDPETATWRRNAILDEMVSEGYIAQDQAEYAKSLPLGVIPDQARVRPYDFIADSVIREFKFSPEFAQFGPTAEDREFQLFHGGLRIFSSLDPRLQEIAKSVISQNFPNGSDPTKPTGAIVSVEPATGRILAAHSGLDYGVEQYAIPTQGRRQPGSAAKPFIYAEALRQGFSPNITLSGRSPAYFEGCDEWERGQDGVKNYGNSSFGSLDMPAALKNSVNTASAQLSRVVGVEPILGLMGQMGINVPAALNNEVPGCAVILGGFANGVTPVEMAGAYSTFANNGVFVKPHFIDRIEDRNGNVVWQAQYPPQQIFSPVVNATMVDMMQGVVSGGTGTRARIRGWEVAGKTGTTDQAKDAWFVGYTPTLATAMWMGIVKEPQPMRTTGGGIPATVWQQYMSQALQGQTPVPFPDVEIPKGRLAPGQPVAVPDVTRMSREEAVAALTAAKLFPEFRTVASRAGAGTIVSQNPRAGTTAETGDTIVLGISTGQPPEPSPAPAPPTPGPPGPTLPPQPDSGGDNDGVQAALDELARRRGGGRPSPPGPDPPGPGGD